MKLLMTLVFCASSLFAGTVVPNIKWNKNEANDTGAAAAWSKRSNATLGLTPENSFTNDWSADGQVLFSHSGFVIELGADSDLDFDNHNYNAQVGYMINSNLSVGLEYDFANNDGVADASRPSLSVDYKLANGVVIGAGFGMEHPHGTEITSNQFHLGAGHVASNYAAEVVLNYAPQDDDGAFQRMGITGDVVYHLDSAWQIHGIAAYSTSEFELSGGAIENSALGINAEFEYKLTPNFFVNAAPFYAMTNSEAGTLESGTDHFGATLGLRTVWDACQWEFDLGYADISADLAGTTILEEDGFTFRTAYTHHF